LVNSKQTLIEHAKRKVEDDGYNFKKKKSRSGLNASQVQPSLKIRPEIRSKQISEKYQ
jgi:hypothetical protein